MPTLDRPALAALGLVVIQASVALSELGQTARIGALGIGLGLILFAALRSSALLPQGVAITSSLALFMCAVAFEALSAFNGHLVFEPKLIAFRAICYLLIACGVAIGLAVSVAHRDFAETANTTAIVVLIALSAHLTWQSLQEIILIEGTRGSFDESSPVGLGFSSGTLAVAALVIALRSTKRFDYALGIAGCGWWTLICMQSGSRGALFALLLTALFLLAIGFAVAPKRSIVTIALGTVVLTQHVVVNSTLANQAGYIFKRFESVMNLEADASIAAGAYSRAYLLEHNLTLPGLLVLGGEGFDPEAYPHNFEVETFVRLGVVLGVLFLGAVAYLLANAGRTLLSRRANVGVTIILAMGIFTFVNAQTNMMWEVLRPLWLFVGLNIGMIISRKKRHY